MRFRTFLSAALVAGLAGSAFALTSEHTDWGRGAVQFLMTHDEAAKWKTIQNDADADAFIALFWARRDPTPNTPRNEYREQIEERIRYADEHFGTGKTKGSMTDRGHALVVYGAPAKVVQSTTQDTSSPDTSSGGMSNDAAASSPDAMTWTYNDEPVFQTATTSLRFVDRFHTGDWRLDRKFDAASQDRAIARGITQPNLTAPPQLAQQSAPVAAAPAPAPAPAAPAVASLQSEALRAAVESFKAAATNPYEKSPSYLAWDEEITNTGDYFVPVVLYVPKTSGIAPSSGLTFFGVVEDASGKTVAAFEQPAHLNATKDDLFIDTSFPQLPAGASRAIVGLADNGKVVTMASQPMTLAGTIDKTASASGRLILSNNVFAMKEAQKPTEPFAYGGLKVIPKADKTFHRSDDLAYFVELRNPGVVDPTAGNSAVVPVNGDPTPMPKLQVKLDLEGTERDGGKKIHSALPLREMPAFAVKGIPGRFGLGSDIPLASFKPGDYTFTVKIIDTVKKTSYTVSDSFKLVE
ncbi:MAG: GWxTD domain-containing protein [Acidobacteria bacterium]|nr:GWxTD domain-containing protein [Acidobacteriota bacterium]MBV9476964.1 GWxTD domain-containing protein [Acidobacteriota bacterium]